VVPVANGIRCTIAAHGVNGIVENFTASLLATLKCLPLYVETTGIQWTCLCRSDTGKFHTMR
jgi:hypothetical protein